MAPDAESKKTAPAIASWFFSMVCPLLTSTDQLFHRLAACIHDDQQCTISPCTLALGSGNDQPAPRGSRRHSCGAPIVRARLARPFWGDCRRPRRYPQTRTTRQQFQLPFGTPDLYEVGSSMGRVNDWLPRRMAAYSTLLRLDTDFDQNVKNLPCL